MRTLDEVLGVLRAQGAQAHYGRAFEVLVKNLLRGLPIWKNTFREVGLWGDYALGQDIGIDLVAEDMEGRLYGIQAKFYEPGHSVAKADIDSFLAALGGEILFKGKPRTFEGGMIFATTDDFGANADALLAAWGDRVQVFNRSWLESLDGVNWERLAGLSDIGPVVAEKPLRDYQLEAIAAAKKYYAPLPDGTLSHTRGKLIMACGTGKTLTSLRMLEQCTGGGALVLFLVPSIALLNQTLVAWCDDAKQDIKAICVCSDPKAHLRAKAQEDAPDANPNSLALPPITNAKIVADRIRKMREAWPHALTVVFSTYQSIEVVEEAQRLLGREAYPFDFVFCDEAHRTTGQAPSSGAGKGGGSAKEEPSPFIHVHDDTRLLARRRLYMTATPRIYHQAAKAKAKERSIELCSMDDPTLYGEEIYCINFATAVEKGCLSDYKVFVLTIPEAGFEGFEAYDHLSEEEKKALMSKDDDGRATAIKVQGAINALAKRLADSPELDALDRVPSRRAVAFCRTIAASKAISKVFNAFVENPALAQRQPLQVEARHVDGAMGAAERNRHLSWLKADAGENHCRLLTNVRCLSEGVDVPSLDAAIFLSKRNSEIDVVQSVGRVMRRAPGKRYGYIIIPVVIPQDADPEKILDDRDTFGVLWSVLNALRAHDDRFEAEINRLKFRDTQNENFGSSGTSGGHIIVDSGTGGHVPEQTTFTAELFPPDRMEEFRQLLYARLVENCGDRAYFERWAADVAEIAQRHIRALKARVAHDPKAQDAFKHYAAFLQTAVYATTSEEDAYTLLAQQRITEPIFNALFGNNDFTQNNPISRALDKATLLLADLGSEDDEKKLARFYDAVKKRVQGITSPDGRLEIIRTLYDTFFAKAFPAVAQKLGIVFTPIEAVDFILRSADGALREHFGGKTLSDEGVHILDPFTGTGTFVARFLQKDLGLIRRDDLLRKYTHELHANEIVLLSYYIAAVNIENIFHDRQGRKEKYTAFPGIVFGDTFRMREVSEQDTFDDGLFLPNSERILAQNKAPISVIIGNPPYSVAKGDDYPALDARIAETYVAGSASTNNNSLYDSYYKAFRWSSDRLDPRHGGILCYISNGGWLDSNAGAGFRRSLQAEFDEIYVFNLRGNQNTQGEVSRREGGKLFDSGCRCPITILLLVRLPQERHHGNAAIHYKDIGDYKTREEKLHDLIMYRSFFSPEWQAASTLITPNDHGDWINQRNDAFDTFIPIDAEKKFDDKTQSFFIVHSSGLKTQRDPWCYNFNLEHVKQVMERSVAYYNSLLGKPVDLADKTINWSRALLHQHETQKVSPETVPFRKAFYRPFQLQHLAYSRFWNEMVYQIPKLFPTGKRGENVVICVSGVGVTKAFSCIVTDVTPDLELIGKSQCFPLYWYEEKDSDLFGQKALVRHDGVSDWALEQARKRYAIAVTKEDLFHYVYGFLHLPAYRAAYAADLKKSLPRIPFVETVADFQKIVETGRALGSLHLHYEDCEPYPLTEVGTGANPRVEKMAFPGKDKTKVRINDTLTLEGIPLEAHDYVVNGRSPIEWVLDRYQVKTDKASGIVNDPNTADPDLLPGIEHGTARALATLIKRLTTLSLQSLRLIAQLPPWRPQA